MMRTSTSMWTALVCAGLLCSSTWAQSPATPAATPAAIPTAIPSATTGQLPVAALPGWVVLVLKPIGLERVRPVTGVVISADGLVIVPLDFAVPGDQIIILDGGTDIAKNGRAATVKTQLGGAGLTVLSAPLLKRPPATFAATPLETGATIRLAAFPPAEQIAKGAAPLMIAAEVVRAAAPAGQPGDPSPVSIAAGKELPNVSGPLLDTCGNLVGWSSSNGVQSMETTAAPAYLWQTGLIQALGSVPVNLATAPCPVPGANAGTSLDASSESAETGAEADDAQKAAAPVAEVQTPAGQAEAADAAGESDEALGTSGEGGTLVLPGQTAAGQGGHSTLFWMGLGLLLALLLLSAVTAVAWWIRRRPTTLAAPAPSLLQDAPPRYFRGGRNTEPPVVDSPPEPSDCVLEINGNLPNGTAFKASCNVRSAAVDAVLGRGGSDIVIDSQDVQRAHARFGGSAEMLTITDLGSSRGTWINRVPCLKGEIMFIGPDDLIFLGDVSFRVMVRPS